MYTKGILFFVFVFSSEEPCKNIKEESTRREFQTDLQEGLCEVLYGKLIDFQTGNFKAFCYLNSCSEKSIFRYFQEQRFKKKTSDPLLQRET